MSWEIVENRISPAQLGDGCATGVAMIGASLRLRIVLYHAVRDALAVRPKDKVTVMVGSGPDAGRIRIRKARDEDPRHLYAVNRHSPHSVRIIVPLEYIPWITSDEPCTMTRARHEIGKDSVVIEVPDMPPMPDRPKKKSLAPVKPEAMRGPAKKYYPPRLTAAQVAYLIAGHAAAEHPNAHKR